MNNERMIKTAKGLDTFAKIVGIILCAGMVLLLVGGVLLFAVMSSQMRPSFINFSQSISVGNLTIAVKEGPAVRDPAALRRWFLAAAATAMIVMAVICIGLRTVRRILKPMKEGRPFDTDIPASLKRLGWIVIAGGILSSALETFSSGFLWEAYDSTKIFNMDLVTGWTYRASFDLSFIAVAFVLFQLSYVFSYGEELQREADETL
ncbi:MAG: DUF2975 domain-containing protein [Solobacterium sp.]|nr:DUF2975 domain-containing protein [Solobacterium sp.]